VGLGSIVKRLDGLAGRFNAWFGPTAVATNAEHSGASKGVPPDSVAVVAALGELGRDKEKDPRD